MSDLLQLTGSDLARAMERLRNPIAGGKVEAAREFGVDLTLLMEQIKLSKTHARIGSDCGVRTWHRRTRGLGGSAGRTCRKLER